MALISFNKRSLFFLMFEPFVVVFFINTLIKALTLLHVLDILELFL